MLGWQLSTTISPSRIKKKRLLKNIPNQQTLSVWTVVEIPGWLLHTRSNLIHMLHLWCLMVKITPTMLTITLEVLQDYRTHILKPPKLSIFLIWIFVLQVLQPLLVSVYLCLSVLCLYFPILLPDL